jgi:hypothetical protein
MYQHLKKKISLAVSLSLLAKFKKALAIIFKYSLNSKLAM